MLPIQKPFYVTVPVRVENDETEHWPAEVVGVAMDGDRDARLVVIVKHDGIAHAQLVDFASLPD